ncbi:MAG: hypothetical protein NTX03_11770 [Bacteroidetes bacterium]|nr:hypothetical protein [Bacteroidota bacterium]
MKNVKKALFLMVMSTIALTYSCTKDDTTIAAPTLTVTPTPSGAVNPGDVVLLTIQCSTTETLKGVKIQEDIVGSTSLALVKDSTVSAKSVTWAYSYKVPSGVSSKTITVTATDNGSRSTSKKITITVNSSTPTTYTSKTLGDQGNPNIGSFFSASDGSIYTSAQAKSNQLNVDIIYYYGATNKASFAGPGGTKSPGVKDFTAFDLGSWNSNTKNATKFKKSSTALYTGITTGATIAAAYASSAGTEDEEINNLAIGDVVAFKKASGSYGILKITGLIPNGGGTTGTITFDAMVQ